MEGLIKGCVYVFIFYVYTQDKNITGRLSALIFIGLSNEKKREHMFRTKSSWGWTIKVLEAKKSPISKHNRTGAVETFPVRPDDLVTGEILVNCL